MTQLPHRPSAPSASNPDDAIYSQIAEELGVKAWQVKAAVELLDGGSTVPFIARYRKEATGTLDDAQLRDLDERLRYLRELADRRGAVLEAVEAQGQLTPELRKAILAADTKSRLEDIYLPFKSKRRTKAQIAREAGLEPLADSLLKRPDLDPEREAAKYLNADHSIGDPAAALAGARAILVERVGQDPDLAATLRERLWTQGRMVSRVKKGKESDGQKFADYFEFAQAPAGMPSHRVLALLRGEKDGVLELDLAEADPTDDDALAAARARYESAVAKCLGVAHRGRPADAWLVQTAQVAWRSRLLARLTADLRGRMFAAAEDEAVRVFAANLRDVLLAAPAGNRATLGLDPGLRTGVKVAVVDGTGKVVATDTVYPHAPARKWDEALATLVRLARQHAVELVAIGNGTASRETDKLAAELIKLLPDVDRKPQKLVVSEAGASVYSASALAAAELPGMDVSLRGAVSIARRLQDPLAELVKIDPKSIGVGQYQHDVTASKLDRSLDAVVEDCVNAVGVDVNTASPALLSRVAGVGPLLSENIVAYRNQHGPFAKRSDLKKVPRLGAKAFEQCAGFLRITGGAEPLDASSVHPESYAVARKILVAAGSAPASSLDPRDFVDDSVGLPTVQDILSELDKPGRDPRPAFAAATFSEGIEKISDLKPGMVLEGTVTNVAAFGAFVDVGVHQDGLVHVSAMSNRFVSDPREVVKSGQVVRVKVLEADPDRKRISLTLRLDDEPTAGRATSGRGGNSSRNPGRGKEQGGKPGNNVASPGHSSAAPSAPAPSRKPAPVNTAMAEALRKAGLGK
ncbi:competence protein ComEA-like protein with helix-hairpin-helix repeat region [Pseudarthrobacter phenanthrenivorans Sphe3]|uniref:Competence protein ComEA-like protein with helix-hairpin-helix repeat region n=1 Tax=Pseudarthrobacter phenanthrenivorans (strain DSM 18606 / JCM 16027 / LMG 23796 / Sphe3) TaxID=930171 RepID=F0M2E8_PSEPM|nr:Tex family protein [Pseudarthrobacter phenanthrenivorans]ADX72099.1 competence protein ComEA-like protein with helix-hairpin-helix repeat region [Pseudarthrobacter phenanthrenivorans Sphe3]